MKHIPYVQTDGGRIAGERKDCTVRTLSIACNVSYQTAWLALSKLGRKKGRPFALSRNAEQAARLVGKELYKLSEVPKTLGSLLKSFPDGNLIVIKRGHAFAVRDGVVYDNFIGEAKPRPLWRIKLAWIVLP